MFSVQKFYAALKSQSLPFGKNTLHDHLAHLEDAFLVRTVSLHTAPERQRMVNPRQAYPIDPGLISPLPKPLRWQPAIAWLLGDELAGGGNKRRGPRRSN